MRVTLHDIEQAIEQSPPELQRQLLVDLPRLVHLGDGDVGLLKLAESAFAFWDNPDDAVYDAL